MLNTHVCSNTNRRPQSAYSVTQESVSDLAMPMNLIRGSSLVINWSNYTYAINCYLIALPHLATRSVAASLECQHTGRLGVWACDCVCSAGVVFMLAD